MCVFFFKFDTWKGTYWAHGRTWQHARYHKILFASRTEEFSDMGTTMTTLVQLAVGMMDTAPWTCSMHIADLVLAISCRCFAPVGPNTQNGYPSVELDHPFADENLSFQHWILAVIISIVPSSRNCIMKSDGDNCPVSFLASLHVCVGRNQCSQGQDTRNF